MKNQRSLALTRRRALLAAPALILSAAAARALPLTPPMTAGPFYPDPVPAEADADLTRYRGGAAPGEVIEMTGRVLSAKGGALPGAVIEIWHCDPRGVYAHVGRRTDPHFQGYGAVAADAGGGYRFRTTRPGLYPGRARHIHVAARAGDARLTTQMFFPDDPSNDGDFLLERLVDPSRLIARAEAGPPPRYVFDMVLG